MTNKPQSRIKRVADKKVKVEKRKITTNKPSTSKIISSLIKK